MTRLIRVQRFFGGGDSQSALDRCAKRIGNMLVRYADVSGPMRGIDKRCAAEAVATPGPAMTRLSTFVGRCWDLPSPCGRRHARLCA